MMFGADGVRIVTFEVLRAKVNRDLAALALQQAKEREEKKSKTDDMFSQSVAKTE